MRSFVWRVIINALALLAVAALMTKVNVTPGSAIIAALLLGVMNAFIRPILMLFSIPLNIITLGLFTFVINGFMLWLVARFVRGFSLGGFGTAILAALLLSIISAVLSWLLGAPDKRLD